MNNETQATGTSISKEYLEELKKAKLLDRDDSSKIAELTRQVGIREGKGYTTEHIRNFLLRQYTTTPEIVSLITSYFMNKKKLRDKVAEQQKEFIAQLTQ